VIRFSGFEQLGVAVAAFSDRSDGDCSLTAGSAGRERLCAQCHVDPSHLVCARQVHGIQVVRARESDRGRGALAWDRALPDTDGIVTDVPGLPLAILVADCVPLYLYDPRRGAVGLVHAGRRGTLDDIVGRAVAALEHEFDCHPEHLHALVGPSAGPEHYEVSCEIAREFSDAGLPARGRLLDLWEANARLLTRAGIPREHVSITAICTLSDTRFHSYRRDAGNRRNMALLVL
jgi:purine-nucleoside/S-methyl-5'-thioadenosine phosphorylase / adenosine deaminase